jgi:hypothetical protein
MTEPEKRSLIGILVAAYAIGALWGFGHAWHRLQHKDEDLRAYASVIAGALWPLTLSTVVVPKPRVEQ